jgi:hypothetical protein
VYFDQIWVLPDIAYRDKKLSVSFVRFRAPLHLIMV